MSAFTPSAGPRWERCLGSAVLPQASEEFDSARKGTAQHAFMRSLALGVPRAKALESVPDEFRKDCERIEAPEDVDKGWPELGLALDLAAETARHFAPDMTREQVRAARRPDEVGMLVDWLAVQGERVLVTDYKFGWQEDLGAAADHLQLLTYTATALLAFGKEEARGELWHWDGVRWRVDGVTLDFLGALEVLDRVRALLARADAARIAYAGGGHLPSLRLGKWCAWCPAQRFCPARNQAAQAVVRTDMAPIRVAELTPEEAGAAYQRLKMLKAWAEQGMTDLESIAGQTPLPLPDGTVLRQQDREVTRIDPAAAEDWLRKTFGDKAAGAAVETRVVMTWEGLKDALRTEVLPGLQQAHREGRLQGKKPSLAGLVHQARSGLESIGAVSVSTYTACKPVRPELPADAQPPEPGRRGNKRRLERLHVAGGFMFNREKYRQEAAVIGPSVLGDLLRATDADVEVLKRAVGWKEDDFHGTTDPARRALTHLLRGREAAKQVQERASETGPSWVEESEKSREGQEWDPLACRWVEKGAKGPAIQWNRTTGA